MVLIKRDIFHLRFSSVGRYTLQVQRPVARKDRVKKDRGNDQFGGNVWMHTQQLYLTTYSAQQATNGPEWRRWPIKRFPAELENIRTRITKVPPKISKGPSDCHPIRISPMKPPNTPPWPTRHWVKQIWPLKFMTKPSRSTKQTIGSTWKGAISCLASNAMATP
jgi:hypothetical protein